MEELKERKISKIANLKIQFHKNFGYYISINKSKVNLAPQHWIKRQTLTNEERYITSEIKNKENKIFQIKNRASSREYEIFCELRNIVAEKTKQIRSIAKSIASLDALLGLSITSIENNFIKPVLIPIDSQKNITKVISGRNPIVEQLLNDKKFIANDIYFDENQKLIILTGPNASGKSCFIRQIGLIQILAQIGCFIPANKAEIKISDRIFTRIGAVDDQSSGQSTFMVEMSETASILNQATSNSLVLLDEIGRGTSTFDGLSIAWSVSEYLAKKIKCNTIFATHYHELNYLKNSNNNIENFQVLVEQNKNQLIFSHKIAKGGSNKSYGIEAAKLAGVPREVIKNAKLVLNSLEENNKFNNYIN
jgi:DNA mismatch repair protein MutS